MARPKNQDARDTRRTILDKSLELFAEHGFTGSSMRDLARAVGVRESALYHHFPNKAAILETILTEAGPGRLNAFVEGDVLQRLETEGPEDFLRSVTETAVNVWATTQERRVLRVVMSEWPRLKALGLFDPQAQVQRVRARLAQLFAELVRRGVFRPVDPHATALRFMGPVMLLRVLYLSDVDGVPDLKALRADLALHLTTFWDSVKPERPARLKRRTS